MKLFKNPKDVKNWSQKWTLERQKSHFGSSHGKWPISNVDQTLLSRHYIMQHICSLIVTIYIPEKLQSRGSRPWIKPFILYCINSCRYHIDMINKIVGKLECCILGWYRFARPNYWIIILTLASCHINIELSIYWYCINFLRIQ